MGNKKPLLLGRGLRYYLKQLNSLHKNDFFFSQSISAK